MSIRDETTKPSQEYLARRADQVRERMLDRVSTLDERGQDLKESVMTAAKDVKRRIPLILGVAAVSLAAGIFITRRLQSRHERHNRSFQLGRQEHSSLLTRALRDAAVALLVQVARRAAEKIALGSLRHASAHRALPAPVPDAARMRTAE
ncbi:MAG TPA: hypothetical protein VKP30_31460 [Polyangiaceae bacterium]|nr:hypothetical protein [Polyangiaceae bacterium]